MYRRTIIALLIVILSALFSSSMIIMFRLGSDEQAYQRAPKEVKKLIDKNTPSYIPKKKFILYVVLDDAGMSLEEVKKIPPLKGNYTIAIIPRLTKSKEIAEYLREHDIPYIVHLPMEPLGDVDAGDYALTTDTSDRRLGNLIQYNFNDIAGYMGVNNHMGSKATVDKRVIDSVLDFLDDDKQTIVVLDSRTTADSIFASHAKERNFIATQRDVFIDNYDDLLYIKEQIRKGVEKAKEKGYAILIGHVTKEYTVQALAEMYDEIHTLGGAFRSLTYYLDEHRSTLPPSTQ